MLIALLCYFAAEETEDDEVAAAGYEMYYTKAVKDDHIPKLNDTSFNTTIQHYDISVVFFFLPCELYLYIVGVWRRNGLFLGASRHFSLTVFWSGC